MAIKPYSLPSSRETRLKVYYELRANADLVEKQIQQSINLALSFKDGGIGAIGDLIMKHIPSAVFGAITKTIQTLNAKGVIDSSSEKDRIVQTFNYYDTINSANHKQWHTMELTDLNVRMQGIQRDINSIKASNDRAKRRYLPARLHMASGLARIMAQKSTGFGGAALSSETPNHIGTGLALGALALTLK